MKTKNLLIIVLICILIILVLVDICTGIFYWNRLHLMFNHENFNNVVTPIVSILAFVIYSATLFYLVSQNEIMLSQNVKPYYERELEILVQRANQINIYSLEGNEMVKYTAFNYINSIRNTYKLLRINSMYKSDLIKAKNGMLFNIDYIESRDYFKNLDNLVDFSNSSNSIYLFQTEVLELMDSIKKSKMIEEDKVLLMKKVKQLFLNEYISFMESLKNDGDEMYPPFPLVYLNPDDKIMFCKLSETNFGMIYNRLIINK